MSSGAIVRTSTTSTEMPSSSCEAGRRVQAGVERVPVADAREVGALALHVGGADRDLVGPVGYLALDRAVGLLVLEEQHGVGVADRAAEHPGRVGRGGGHHHLEAGDVRVEGLDRLRVVQRSVDAPAAGRADHQRTSEVAVRAVAEPGRLGHDLIERGVDEVGELDLGDREQAVQGHADRDADDAGFGQRACRSRGPRRTPPSSPR